MNYPGYMVKDFRESLDRPVWKNCSRDPDVHPYPSARDMCAMINYCLKKRGIDKVLPLRTYHGWEIGRYPLWFRTSMFWMCNDIRHIVNMSFDYELMQGGDYEGNPIIREAQTMDERLSNVRIDPECCRQ